MCTSAHRLSKELKTVFLSENENATFLSHCGLQLVTLEPVFALVH